MGKAPDVSSPPGNAALGSAVTVATFPRSRKGVDSEAQHGIPQRPASLWRVYVMSEYMARTWLPVVINMTMMTSETRTRTKAYSAIPCPRCKTCDRLELIG